ncbi:MAG: hypothetical protein ACE5F1_01350 [Planctomycetota bacterium]
MNTAAKGLRVFLCVVSGFVLLARPATAQRDVERKIEAAKKKIHALLEKAEDLQERGSHEDAREVRQKAEQIEEKIHAYLRKRGADRGDRGREADEGRKILEALEHGIWALKRIGRKRELEQLQEVAAMVREKLHRGRKSDGRRERDDRRGSERRGSERRRAERRERGEHRLEILRLAFETLMKAEKVDAADSLEHAIHALELTMEKRRDEKALQIRETAPGPRKQAEFLGLAARILRDWHQQRESRAVAELAEQLAGERRGRRERDRASERDSERRRKERRGGGRERAAAKRRLEVMRLAMKALSEADRRGAAEGVEHAIHALELALEGRRDEEAMHVRETAPNRSRMAELMGLAAEILDDMDQPDRAEIVGRLAREYSGRRGERGEREDSDAPDRGRERRGDREDEREHRGEPEETMGRIHRLEDQLAELMKAVEQLQRELRRSRRRIR